MDLGIRGRTAVVSGGARGTGLEIAKRLSAEGANVVLTGRHPDMVADAERAVRAEGGQALGVVTDVLSKEGPAVIRAAAEKAFGPVAINIYNFSVMTTDEREFLRITDEEFYACIEGYYMAIIRMLRQFLPGMQQLNWGRVILLGSANMKNASIMDPLTSQSVRGAAPLLFKNLTYEFGKHNIAFNTIAIGAIKTDLARAYLDTAPPGSEEGYAEAVPLKRWGLPSELATFVTMLCAREMVYLNGETIRFDGGQTRSVF